MKVAVWDTYSTNKKGEIMHFDILVPEEVTDTETIYGFGKEYLQSKGQNNVILSSRECQFCHVEQLRPDWELDIQDKGYFIIEMQGCN